VRIISKYNDYYDSVQKYGQDLSTIYLRQEEFLDTRKFSHFDELFNVHRPSFGILGTQVFSYIPFLVLINDKVFVGFRLTLKVYLGLDVVEYCYDEASCIDFLKRNSKEHLKEYTEKKKGYRAYYYRNGFNESFVPKFFETKVPDTQRICIEHSTPVILIGRKKCYEGLGPNPFDTSNLRFDTRKDIVVVKNPCLKSIEFYKAMDTNSTFQEIESFLSGVLPGGTPKMVTISEKNNILKHGFDYKLSFRKAKQK
jgi:hypothetical protein